MPAVLLASNLYKQIRTSVTIMWYQKNSSKKYTLLSETGNFNLFDFFYLLGKTVFHMYVSISPVHYVIQLQSPTD